MSKTKLPKTQLQTRCPNCKAQGGNVLLLSVTFLRAETGSPCVECAVCHALFALGDLLEAPKDFYVDVPLVGVK